MIELFEGLSYSATPTGPEVVSGTTSSREVAEGRRWSWGLRVQNLQYAIWETLWSTGERELVLADQDVTAATPISVAKLMSRRRALVESVRDLEYVSARQVFPDADGWPRFSNCSENDLRNLIPTDARAVLEQHGYLGHDTRASVLGSAGPNRNQLLGLFDPGSRAGAVGFYVLSRLVPTFRDAGILD
jgi:hypothetical protein